MHEFTCLELLVVFVSSHNIMHVGLLRGGVNQE
jgi:hypothetical protein